MMMRIKMKGKLDGRARNSFSVFFLGFIFLSSSLPFKYQEEMYERTFMRIDFWHPAAK